MALWPLNLSCVWDPSQISKEKMMMEALISTSKSVRIWQILQDLADSGRLLPNCLLFPSQIHRGNLAEYTRFF
jgi:hypothetical protein